ncbi:MAG: dihydroxyacetone kinase subunit DhaK [Streptococcus sp.]
MLAEDEIEYGIGIHGEPGYRGSLSTFSPLAEKLTGNFEAFEAKTGDACLLINGMGATPLMEHYLCQ